jgi:hypothetical protein
MYLSGVIIDVGYSVQQKIDSMGQLDVYLVVLEVCISILRHAEIVVLLAKLALLLLKTV